MSDEDIDVAAENLGLTRAEYLRIHRGKKKHKRLRALASSDEEDEDNGRPGNPRRLCSKALPLTHP